MPNSQSKTEGAAVVRVQSLVRLLERWDNSANKYASIHVKYPKDQAAVEWLVASKILNQCYGQLLQVLEESKQPNKKS